jgi:hypothetical protein
VRFAQADRMTIQSFGWASHWHDGALGFGWASQLEGEG